MRRAPLALRLCAAWLVAIGLPARAQVADSPTPDVAALVRDPAFQHRLQKWRSMTSAEKDKLRTRLEQWKRHSSEDRDRLSRNLVRFKTLPPDRQAALQRRLQELPPEQRERLRSLAARAHGFVRMHQIPMGLFSDWLRHSAREEIDRIRGLPAEERHQAVRALVHRFYEFTLQRVESQLPDAEQAAFRDLPFSEKLARARRWFADRRGKESSGRGPGAPGPRRAPGTPH